MWIKLYLVRLAQQWAASYLRCCYTASRTLRNLGVLCSGLLPQAESVISVLISRRATCCVTPIRLCVWCSDQEVNTSVCMFVLYNFCTNRFITIFMLYPFFFSRTSKFYTFAKKASASGGLRPPGPLSGLCPWTPLGNFHSPDPLTSCPPYVHPEYATAKVHVLLRRRQDSLRPQEMGLGLDLNP